MGGEVCGEIRGHLVMMTLHMRVHMPLIAHLRPAPLLMAAGDLAGEVGLCEEPTQDHLTDPRRTRIHQHYQRVDIILIETRQLPQRRTVGHSELVFKRDGHREFYPQVGPVTGKQGPPRHGEIARALDEPLPLLGNPLEVGFQTPAGSRGVDRTKTRLAHLLAQKGGDPLPLVLITPLGIEIHAEYRQGTGRKFGELL